MVGEGMEPAERAGQVAQRTLGSECTKDASGLEYQESELLTEMLEQGGAQWKERGG